MEEEALERLDDVSSGKNADSSKVVEDALPLQLRKRFEIYSYRNAASILSNSFPDEYKDILRALDAFSITTDQIRAPGGSKSVIAKYVDTLFAPDWRETRISADLHVKLLPPKGSPQPERTAFRRLRPV